ncbi:SAM-dependent methyltransferase [Methanopyrus sp. KOL6]|uniref:SAM-dependent methyltransferase n=1 Tax=Methanopyrus sp. KOL6 TaxID=1937004 RepID=UPI000B4A9AF8|nr:THUMP domain-containing protein [Methanopyrus sp. KOL6]
MIPPFQALVTCPAGFEFRCVEELEGILKEEDPYTEAEPTYFKGVVVVRSDLEPEEIVEIVKDADTDWVAKIVPIHRTVRADLDVMKRTATILARRKLGENTSFAVRCRKRGKPPFGQREVEVKVGAAVQEATGAPVDLEDPDYYVWIEVLQDTAGISVAPPDLIVSKEVKRVRKWSPGMRPISRAQLKLRELLKRHPYIVREGSDVIDLGAAPGGWSYELARRVESGTVYAVDPGDLHPKVLELDNVVHLKKRAEELTEDDIEGRVRLVTSDLNRIHTEATEITLSVADEFLEPGGFIVQTVKLAVDPSTGKYAAPDVETAVSETELEYERRGYEILAIERLKRNTPNERTLVARKV